MFAPNQFNNTSPSDCNMCTPADYIEKLNCDIRLIIGPSEQAEKYQRRQSLKRSNSKTCQNGRENNTDLMGRCDIPDRYQPSTEDESEFPEAPRYSKKSNFRDCWGGNDRTADSMGRSNNESRCFSPKGEDPKIFGHKRQYLVKRSSSRMCQCEAEKRNDIALQDDVIVQFPSFPNSESDNLGPPRQQSLKIQNFKTCRGSVERNFTTTGRGGMVALFPTSSKEDPKSNFGRKNICPDDDIISGAVHSQPSQFSEFSRVTPKSRRNARGLERHSSAKEIHSEQLHKIHTLTGEIPLFNQRLTSVTQVVKPSRVRSRSLTRPCREEKSPERRLTKAEKPPYRSVSRKRWPKKSAVHDESTLLAAQELAKTQCSPREPKIEKLDKLFAKERRHNADDLHPMARAMKCCRKGCTTVAAVGGALGGGIALGPMGLVMGAAVAGEATNSACKKLERQAQRRFEMRQVQKQANGLQKECELL